MSNEINLSTSVKYYQFLNIDDTVEFLVDELNLKKGSDFNINSEDEITFFNGQAFTRTNYIFNIEGVLNIWFDDLQEIFIEHREKAEMIIKNLIKNELAHDQYLEAIYSNKRLNCPLSISGNCKALEGK